MHQLLKCIATLTFFSLLTGCLGSSSDSDESLNDPRNDTGVSAVGSRIFLSGYPAIYDPATLSVSVSQNGTSSPIVTVSGIPDEAKTLIAYVLPYDFNYLESIRKNGVVKVFTQSVDSPSVEIEPDLETGSGYLLSLPTHGFLSEADNELFLESSAYLLYLYAVTQDEDTVKSEINNWGGYLQIPNHNEDYFSAIAIASEFAIFKDASFNEIYKEFIGSMNGEGYFDFSFDAASSSFDVYGNSELFTTTHSLKLTDQTGKDYPLNITTPSADDEEGSFRVSFQLEELRGKKLSLTYQSNSGLSQVVGSVDIPSNLDGFTFERLFVEDIGDSVLVYPNFSSEFESIDLYGFYHESGIYFYTFSGSEINFSFDNFDTEWDFEKKAWIIPKNRVTAENNIDISDVDWLSAEAGSFYLEIAQRSGLGIDFEWSASTYDP